ncbi:hypothetical protein [Novosphingobium sp.]|uniref:hypothetical protein n=1 Tax=Novosphingobium sp. TaxID=1874826 RepID=UPI0025EB63D5|nr:hypothetical protein [Novosphingobium sp.]
MEQQSQIFHLTWQGVEVQVTFTPRYCGFMEHLAIESIAPERAPLPITGTGYLSHFMPPGTITAHGGDVFAQVRAWLDEEAANLDWQARVDASRQGELF